MTEWIESGEASRRSGLRLRARQESISRISRLRIFSFTWAGRSGSGRVSSECWRALAGLSAADGLVEKLTRLPENDEDEMQSEWSAGMMETEEGRAAAGDDGVSGSRSWQLP